MSCVRESSPQSEHAAVTPRPESKRTWNPLRGLRRMFRRNKQPSPEPNEVKSLDDSIEPPSLDTSKSRSTSQLIDEPFTRSRNLHSTLKSVSHDSVFNPEQHPGQSDSESAVSIPQMIYPAQANIQAELQEKLRRRRKIQNDDDSDDIDDGLPRSPSMHSPIIATGNDLLLNKELITKSSHSTCSDGSLLSMDSSEMDEDSLGAHNSRYSSRISLHDRRPPQNHHQESSDGDSSTSVPLSHSAAKHRMAIRPKRNPRSKKPLTATNALPATPEVNEEHSGRSTSPEAKPPRTAAADTSDGTTNVSTTASTTVTTTATLTTTNTITTNTTTTTTPNISASDTCTTVSMVSTCDLDASIDEISVENVPRREEGFFHRLLSRRSTKKKTKSPSMEDVDVDRFLFDETMGAKPRQREEPPPAGRMQLSYPPDLPPDHQIQPQNYHCGQNVSAVEDIFEPDTFTPIKQSFSLGQQMIDDDTTSSSVGGSSVQKSLSSDSVSSTVLDEPVANVVEHEITSERCRSYSSSDSEHLTNNGYQRPLPVPAPRLSKLHNGCGGGVGSADVVVRRKKRDDQQPELLKVFARRSLKLGQDGEPELLIVAGGGDDDNAVHQQENECSLEETNITVSDNDAVAMILQLADERKRQSDPEVDVNENQTLADVPRFKRIQQRREEWEKRLLQQQQN